MDARDSMGCGQSVPSFSADELEVTDLIVDLHMQPEDSQVEYLDEHKDDIKRLLNDAETEAAVRVATLRVAGKSHLADKLELRLKNLRTGYDRTVRAIARYRRKHPLQETAQSSGDGWDAPTRKRDRTGLDLTERTSLAFYQWC